MLNLLVDLKKEVIGMRFEIVVLACVVEGLTGILDELPRGLVRDTVREKASALTERYRKIASERDTIVKPSNGRGRIIRP